MYINTTNSISNALRIAVHTATYQSIIINVCNAQKIEKMTCFFEKKTYMYIRT